MEYIAELSPHNAIKRFSTLLGNEDDMIFALPSTVAQALIVVFHWISDGCGFERLTTSANGRLRYKSNFDSLPGRAGGFPIGSIKPIPEHT